MDPAASGLSSAPGSCAGGFLLIVPTASTVLHLSSTSSTVSKIFIVAGMSLQFDDQQNRAADKIQDLLKGWDFGSCAAD